MANKVIKIDPDFCTGSGVGCFLGWKRLEESLQKTGELAANEYISGLEVTDYGIQYYIKKND